MDDDDGYLELDELGNPIGADIVESDDDDNDNDNDNDVGTSFLHDPFSPPFSFSRALPAPPPTGLDAPSDDEIEAEHDGDDPMSDPNYVDDSAC